ncbi:MAG: hypothetical protein V3R66_07330 [Rhodospirillales bacterium]
MIKSKCTKLDCFFRVGDTCCNLCAVGDDTCDLYWPADKAATTEEEDIHRPEPAHSKNFQAVTG